MNFVLSSFFRLPAPVAVPFQGSGLKRIIQLTFPKGFSMNLVLIIWALCGGLLIYAFLANFRTVLLMPHYGKPIDSAQDILDRGMIPFVQDGGDYYKQFLKESSNPTYQKLGEILVVPKYAEQWKKMIREDIQGANTHVLLGFLYDKYKSWG